jgi:hypothetical protein
MPLVSTVMRQRDEIWGPSTESSSFVSTLWGRRLSYNYDSVDRYSDV